MKILRVDKERTPRNLSWRSTLTNIWTSTRPRNISEYFIEPDEPYKTYSPGDRVKGFVVLNIERPTRITHLTICLHGFVQVLKNGRTPGDSTQRWREYLSTGQGKCGEAFFGNGLAALFKDEIVLAGDGCLGSSSYRFQYDLKLPSKGIPSSIDFQHGHISYMLSATLTRPVAMSATSRCEHKIAVKEGIDVAPLPQPSPQVIPLETSQKRPGRPKSNIGLKRGTISGSSRPHNRNSIGVPHSGLSDSSDGVPQSPCPSDISSVSTVSSGNQGFEIGSGPALVRDGNPGIDEKCEGFPFTSSVTIEVLTSGCLPGNSVPIRLSVNLAKAVKSLQGIIVTLYRECHVDLHPSIPLGLWQQGKRQEYEDYYPKSHTGLGGLSLSSGGSSRVFRQDINQTFTPLILDPRTFTAHVKTSVQVPEGVFPTISSVPGAMIDFKYYIEIVIDLRGRSAGQERFLPRLSMVNAVPNFGTGDPKSTLVEGYDGVKTPFASGFCFLDTSQIRREKGVVTHIAEIIVGTWDSERSRGKQADGFHKQDFAISGAFDHGEESARRVIEPHCDPECQGAYENSANVSGGHQGVSASGPSTPTGANPWPPYVAPPTDIEENVDEKIRLRRAEQFLLPSAPPRNNRSSSSSGPQVISAMDAMDDARLDESLEQPGASAPAYEEPSAPALETIRAYPTTSFNASESSQQAHVNVPNGHSEDKQELERRRLQEQASSPDQFSDGYRLAHSLEPSAPMLNEDGEDISAAQGALSQQRSHESLPRYRK
ncbi:MAG: hypothetical protein Q9214_000555 [Letrouitia sp. 1 TL-2023]